MDSAGWSSIRRVSSENAVPLQTTELLARSIRSMLSDAVVTV